MNPVNEAELAEAISAANGPLIIQGGGTRPVGNPVEGELLSVAGLTGIQLYEPGALTIVVNAGTPVDQVVAALDAEGQQLAFEPIDHRKLLGTTGTPTIGGLVAGNYSGSRRISVGACRDFLLGVRFVDGQGSIIKNGGRVMKNVTGYDLVKLLCGSHGTLGVLSEVALKVLPIPEMTAVLTFNNLSARVAVKVLGRALGSPFEVSGAAHADKGPAGSSLTMIRLEGFENSVTYRVGKLTELLGNFGEVKVETSPLNTADIWRWICNVEGFSGREGDVWRVSAQPTDGPDIADAIKADDVVFDWGGGLIWALVPRGTDLRNRLAGFKGHASLMRADPETRTEQGVFHPEPAPLAAISAGLRKKFDPRGILNIGLMG